MAIRNLYSKRQKILRGEVPDVLIFDFIPEQLRIQVYHIVTSVLTYDLRDSYFSDVHRTLCYEYGVMSLKKGITGDQEIVFYFLTTGSSLDQTIDVIELMFQLLNEWIRPRLRSKNKRIDSLIDNAISELNERFKEHGIGYSFENNQIIRIDSTFVHVEITRPTISLLHHPKFLGANEEYLNAHDHYRHGKNKECLTDCLKAFESTMKIICKEKGWACQETDPSKKLIQVCFDNGLVPTSMQSQLTSLRSLLESGIPTLRNKLSGHGQGQIPQIVNDETTRYGLNLTGSNIIYLVEISGIK